MVASNPIRSLLHDLRVELTHWNYLRQPAATHDLRDQNRNQLAIATVAFNNPRIIELQIDMLKRFIKDAHHHIVCDNSDKKEASLSIEEICKSAHTSYIRLPYNPLTKFHGSLSHGAAMNWIWRNILKASRHKVIGYLDHDVFPIHPTSICDKLAGKPFWGLKQTRGDRWYLWPGFCYFKTGFLRQNQVDFRPAAGLDTGGRLHPAFSAHHTFESPELTYHTLRGSGSTPQNDQFERFGDWIHTFNGSYWMPTEPKEENIQKLLQTLTADG